MVRKPLNILFLAAEAVPFAKVGGLADVAGALPRAIRSLGHDVRLMIPRYGTIRSNQFNLDKIGDPFPVPVGPGQEHIHLIGGVLGSSSDQQDAVPVYLIWSDSYFSRRDRVYGFEDDAQRFAVFGHSALAALTLLNWKPDVIHANDWHTGIVPTWLNTAGRRDPFYREIASLFTIHNLAYQGAVGRLILTFAQMEYVKHLSVEQPGTVNWMAQGIAHADLVNTVSPQYAQEILTPEMGMGLSPLLVERRERLCGVLNGIDYEQWNPATDPHIPHRFDVASFDRRATNKTALQQQARLPVRPDVPLVGMVSPLEEVKGLDLVEPVLEWLLGEVEAQFIIVGAGQPHYHEMIERVQDRFPDRMRAFLKFDDVLARRIYAGADLFLMPSGVEPCGQEQMIAMRYGCVPVVSAVGGLIDTVADHTAMHGRGTGFTFSGHTAEACQGALQQALDIYRDKKDAWRGIQRRGMSVDFSWSASAKEYVKLYQRAVELHTR
ncbi:MAG TPA: glycogen synthase [Chloroflexi bacterium]|nr:glycogen synthase [Chloroflexota bacterium]